MDAIAQVANTGELKRNK